MWVFSDVEPLLHLFRSDGRESSTVTKVFFVELVDSNSRKEDEENFLQSDQQVIKHPQHIQTYISHQPCVLLPLQRIHISSDRTALTSWWFKVKQTLCRFEIKKSFTFISRLFSFQRPSEGTWWSAENSAGSSLRPPGLLWAHKTSQTVSQNQTFFQGRSDVWSRMLA